MDIQQLIADIISRDTHKVWRASCEIISLGQDTDTIKPLIKFLPLIRKKTRGLVMGGMFAPNQRFVDFAIRTIEFHRDSAQCPCALYEEHGVDPKVQAAKGYIKIASTTRIEGKWVDYYNTICQRCNQEFKVIERESHYMWWEWTKYSDEKEV